MLAASSPISTTRLQRQTQPQEPPGSRWIRKANEDEEEDEEEEEKEEKERKTGHKQEKLQSTSHE